MTGSLQEKNGIYYAVFSYYDDENNRKMIWRSTRVPVKRGTKRQAKQRMEEIREEVEERIAKAPPDKNTLFHQFMDLWLEVEKNRVDIVTYEGYKSLVKLHLKPYFEAKKYMIQDITFLEIEEYYNQKAVFGRPV